VTPVSCTPNVNIGPVLFTRNDANLRVLSGLLVRLVYTHLRGVTMSVNWAAFTPWASLIGGALIGLSSALFVLANGRIAGISGILGGALVSRDGGRIWRIMFLVGLIGSSLVYGLVTTLPQAIIEASPYALIVAGLLVGIGTRYGSGCTSGHGVVGLSRLSLRSLVATTSFMASGFVVVYVTKHLI